MSIEVPALPKSYVDDLRWDSSCASWTLAELKATRSWLAQGREKVERLRQGGTDTDELHIQLDNIAAELSRIAADAQKTVDDFQQAVS